MLNIFNIMDRVTDILNEKVSVQFMIGKNGSRDNKFTVIIRNRHEDGRAGNVIQHSTSIKIRQTGTNVTEMVPVINAPYTADDISSLKSDIRSVSKKLNLSSVRSKFVEQFIYDFQEAICAYWYLPNVSDDAKKLLTTYINQKLDDHSSLYYTGSIKPKSEKELEQSKKDFADYLRKELNDPNIKVMYNSHDSGY